MGALLWPPAWAGTQPPPSAQLAADHPLAAGLVAAWGMLEGAGPTVRDLALGHTASPGTAPAWGVSPVGAATAYAPASTQYLDAGNVSVLAGLTRLSVVAWIYLANAFASGFRNVVGKWQDASPREWTLAMGATGGAFDGIVLFVEDTAPTLFSVTSLANQASFVGAWHQVAAVSDGRGAGGIQMYVDGRPNQTGTSPTVALTTSTLAVRIGNHVSNTAYWDGRIGPVLVYNRALSAGEVAALYAQPYAWVAPPARRLWAPAEAPPPPTLGVLHTRAPYYVPARWR